jgi:hypothetical protein
VSDNYLISADNPNLEYFEFSKEYRFYYGIVSFLAGISSISHLINSIYNHSSLINEGAYIHFEGREKVTNKIYFLFPYDIYKYLLLDRWPDSFRLYYKEKTTPDSEKSDSDIGSFSRVFLALGQATFIQYWEEIKSSIISNYGQDQVSWPSILKFGWIIRNALAHNFKITIHNKAINSVQWYNLNFGYQTNGVSIDNEIMFIELIILMKEIEDYLNQNA